MRQAHELCEEHEGSDTERKGEIEQVAPTEVVGHPASEKRTGDRGHAEHGTHDALILSALARRDDVADDRLAERHDRAHTEALDGTREHKEPEVCGHAGQGRTDHEDDEARDIERLAAVHIGELADDRHRDRRNEHGRGRDPAVVLHTAEFGDDARHGGADDRLRDRRDEHTEHEAEEHELAVPVEAGEFHGRVAARHVSLK